MTTIFETIDKTAIYFVPGSPGWRTVIRTVSPLEAAELLKRNFYRNRRLRPGLIKKYSAIMRSGGWLLTPEAIMVSNAGSLINGQHRLTSVVETGIASRFMFVTGVDEDVYHAIDRGAVRSVADATGLSPLLVASATSILSHLYNGMPQTDDEKVRIAGIIGPVHEALLEHCNTASEIFSSAAFRAAACLRVLSGINQDFVFGIYGDLCRAHIANLPPLAQSLASAKMRGRFMRGREQQLDYLLRAWDVFDPEKQNNTKVIIKEKDARIAEMKSVILKLSARMQAPR